MVSKEDYLTWDRYFERENRSLFQILVSLYRRFFISKSVKYYTDRYFPEEGIFIEAGSGTSQSSWRIQKLKRKLIAVDCNHYVLASHNVLEYKVQGDILSLPFKSGISDGLWNLGVMEHLEEGEIVSSLKECRRVLKNNGIMLIYWPPYFAPYNILLNLIRWIFGVIFNRELEFFPHEINHYRNKRRLVKILNEAGLKLIKLDYNIMDLFTYMVIILNVADS